MRSLTLTLLCTLAIPGVVAVAQPCTSAPGPIAAVSFIQPTACIPQLTWTEALRADKYVIYRSLTDSIGDAVVVGTTRNRQYADYTFPASLYGRDLNYFVRGVNACGRGPLSSSQRRRIEPGPRISSGSITTRCNEVTLRWFRLDASPGVAITYSVWRTPSPDGTPVRLAEGLTSPDFVDVNPPQGWFTYSVSTRSPLCEGPPVDFRDAAGHPLSTPRVTVTALGDCGTVGVFISRGTCAYDFSILRAPANDPDNITEVVRGYFSDYYDHVPDRSTDYFYAVVAHTSFGDTAPSPWQRTSVTNNAPRLWPINPSGNSFDCVSGGATLQAPMDYTNDLVTFQWYKDGQPLTDGGTISGSQSYWLHIWPATELDNGAYTVFVATDCGNALSDPFTVRYTEPCPCPPCLPDFNQDGGVDGGDIEAYYFAWEAGDFCADANYDGGVDGRDIEDWFMCFESCSC